MITQTLDDNRYIAVTILMWVSRWADCLSIPFRRTGQQSQADGLAVANEASLIKRARHGDPDAWDSIFNRYYPEIYAYMRYRAATIEDAEDLAATVFERAVQHIRTYKPTGSGLGAWLQRIASNLVVDYYRRRDVPIRKTDALPPYLVDKGTLPLDHVIQADTAKMIQDTLQRLPAAQQEVLVLRFLRGYSIKETASIMGKKTNAIKALQHRALDHMRVVWHREVK